LGERVLIADDDPVVRTLMASMLEDAGFELCGEAANANEAVELAERTRPQLCLLDIYMPGSGIRGAREITARLPETLVLMLTSSTRDQDLLDSLRAGARGYVMKGADSEELLATLRTVLDGEVAMPRELVAKAIRGGGQARIVRLPDGSRAELSARQLELLDMLADGRTIGEIAERAPSGDVEREVAEILALLKSPDPQAAVRLVIGGRTA
jgi:DNA-binding NarL/FixJ family response regulator